MMVSRESVRLMFILSLFLLLNFFFKKKSEIVRTNKREKKWRVRLGGGDFDRGQAGEQFRVGDFLFKFYEGKRREEMLSWHSKRQT